MIKLPDTFQLPSESEYLKWKVPMVEIFETIEGEGSAQGFPTVFVRLFHCNLRCSWCDTPYSYAPDKPEYEASIQEIIDKIKSFNSKRICFTGGEPLIHREKSAALLKAMGDLEHIIDIHVETNGAIPLKPFDHLRETYNHLQNKVRFVMDYKLPKSGETGQMIHDNFEILNDDDEVKFVIGDDEDFAFTKKIINHYHKNGQVLLSPVWESMHPQTLVKYMLEEPLPNVRLSLQMHKVIWDPDMRGV